eukprot:3579670-Rhodomonas_salina.4
MVLRARGYQPTRSQVYQASTTVLRDVGVQYYAERSRTKRGLVAPDATSVLGSAEQARRQVPYGSTRSCVVSGRSVPGIA